VKYSLHWKLFYCYFRVGRGVAVSDNYSFCKGDFLLEYRGVLNDDEADLPDLDTYVYQFHCKSKCMWYVAIVLIL